MDPFIHMFFAIDTHEREYITTSDLRNYVKQNKLDEGMVTKWQNLFDPENTGRITFQKFCDVLGIRPEQTRALRAESVRNQGMGLDPDINVIYENMPVQTQMQIVKEYKRLINQSDKYDPRELSAQLKKWLDSNYGRAWQVVVVHGSFWITFSYTDDSSFQFRHKDESVLIWRTSMDK